MRKVVMVLLMMSLTVSASKVVKRKKVQPTPVDEVSRKFDVMVRVVDDILSRGMADVDNLCGSDELLMSEFEYGSECCARDDSGQCTSTRQTRRKKGLCVRRDESGAVFDSYNSYGVTEYGDCVDLDLDNPAETITPL